MKKTIQILILFFALGLNSVAQTVDLQKGLVAYYPFNGNANDESGNGNHGSICDATLTVDRNGISNHAYSFDGVNDYIDLNNINPVWGKTITISVWVYFSSKPNNLKSPSIIRKRDNEWTLDLYDYNLRFGVGNKTAKYSLSNIALNEWMQITGRLSNNKLDLYINGKKVASEYCNNSITTNSNYLRIGCNGQYSQYFKGKIDVIRIYNRALNEAEINALYNYQETIIEKPVGTLNNFKTNEQINNIKTNLQFSEQNTLDTLFRLNSEVIIAVKVFQEEDNGGSDECMYTKYWFNTLDSNFDIISQIKMDEYCDYGDGGNNFYYRILGDTLLEIQQNNDYYNNNETDYEGPKWIYYSIDNQGKLTKLKSNRRYAFTKFVEMNDEHPFINYIVDIGMPGEDPDHVPSHGILELHSGFTAEQLDYMRNEIFADYGYKFKSERWQKEFSIQKWYQPLVDNVDDSLSTFEKKNIAFIIKQKSELSKENN